MDCGLLNWFTTTSLGANGPVLQSCASKSVLVSMEQVMPVNINGSEIWSAGISALWTITLCT